MAVALKNTIPPVTQARAPGTRRARPRGRRGAVIVGSVLLALVVMGLLAGPVLTRVANRRLADLPEYSGHVGRVQLAWWQGSVRVRNLELWMRGHEKDGPIVLLDRATFTVTPSAWFRGKLGLRASFDGADVMLVKTGAAEKPAKTEEEKAAQQQRRLGEVRRWQTALQGAFPIELTRLEIANSRVRFVDRTVEPHPEMTLDRLELVVRGLGQRPQGGRLPAEARLTGILTGNGRLVATVQADPTAPQPRFDARVEVLDLSLPPVNPFMRAYAKAEVTAGTFEVYIQATAANGRYEGYVKPFFRDLEFKPVPDESQGVLKRMATGAASAVTSLLKNDKNQVATRAPFEGNFADNDVDVWTTVENLLRNAFVQSLSAGLEGQRPTRDRS